jgi:hypothetical protein
MTETAFSAIHTAIAGNPEATVQAVRESAKVSNGAVLAYRRRKKALQAAQSEVKAS